ncbi:MAG: hypothetical protein ABIH00_00765 [Armatimonadota bacterium]
MFKNKLFVSIAIVIILSGICMFFIAGCGAGPTVAPPANQPGVDIPAGGQIIPTPDPTITPTPTPTPSPTT